MTTVPYSAVSFIHHSSFIKNSKNKSRQLPRQVLYFNRPVSRNNRAGVCVIESRSVSCGAADRDLQLQPTNGVCKSLNLEDEVNVLFVTTRVLF